MEALVKLYDSVVTIVDESTVLLMLSHNEVWYTNNNGYVYGYSKILKKSVLLHKLLLNFPRNTVDHINRNKLDNRLLNLRVVSYSVNSQNRGIDKDKKFKAKFKGVDWSPVNKNWRARIRYKYKEYNIGRFDNEIEAALAYNKKALELYGEHAFQNVIPV